MTRLLLPLVALFILPITVQADDWPQWLGPKRDGIWREDGLLDKFPAKGPTQRWKADLGAGNAGPAVVGERVFVNDFQLTKQVPAKPGQPSKKEGNERVLCLDAKNGKVLWKHEYPTTYEKIGYPTGPRTTPVVAGGKVYTLGAMGDLFCLEADTGKVVWSENFIKDYKAPLPVWGWAAHLLLVDDKLIGLVGGEGQAVVAWDAATGKEQWKALTTQEIGYAPPVMLALEGKQHVCVLLSETLNGLDLDGKTLWTQKYPVEGQPKRPAVPIAMPRQDGDLLFASSFYHGALMLRLKDNKPTVVWKSKRENPERADSLHACMSTPIVKDGYIYGIGGYGELRCLKAETGEEKWSTFDATEGKSMFLATAFLTPQGERCWILNDRGELLLTKLTSEKFEVLDRAKVIEPSQQDQNGRQVV